MSLFIGTVSTAFLMPHDARSETSLQVFRGATVTIVVDEDLIAALDDGHIRHAVLDVFRTEPLPSDHAYWRHPKVTITPHNSSATNPNIAAQQVVENIRRVLAGESPFNLVNPLVGY